jgi:hypothetical protein
MALTVNQPRSRRCTLCSAEAPYTHNRWFSQLTVKQIEDERDTPMINGRLGNVCLESNDGHVKDTGGYKNLAEHSTFNVHKFNSQDGVQVDGNVHTIFNANNIPTFADKTQGVRRRTFTIPFKASFLKITPLMKSYLPKRIFYRIC